MLETLNGLLENLQKSFTSNTSEVASNALQVGNELKKLRKLSSFDKIENTDLKRTIKLIDKLSIHNEFKLNFLKDFSSYNTLKK